MFDKYFTPQEAEELLPAVERLTESIRSAKRTLDAYDKEFSALAQKINDRGGMMVNLDEWSGKRLLRESVANKMAEEVGSLQGLGVIPKDFEMGLVDFPSLLGDEEVFLCWKSGEAQIQFWHRTTEGYLKRKPLAAMSLPSSSKSKKSVQ